MSNQRRNKLAKLHNSYGYNILTCETTRLLMPPKSLVEAELEEAEAAAGAAAAERLKAVEALVDKSARRQSAFIKEHAVEHRMPIKDAQRGARKHNSASREAAVRAERDAIVEELEQLQEKLNKLEASEDAARKKCRFDGFAELERRARDGGFRLRQPRFKQRRMYQKGGGENATKFNEWVSLTKKSCSWSTMTIVAPIALLFQGCYAY